jgi:hypothetical protein
MTVSTVEVLRGFDADSVAYRQVPTADHENATEVLSIIAAGDAFPRFVAANGSKEGIPFETNQLAALLAQCGLQGCDASPVTLFYQLVDNLSGRVDADDEDHSIVEAASARMYISNITATNRGLAAARGRIVPVSDGTNAPLIRTGSEALTAAPSTAEAFVLGPISMHSTKVKACNNLDVNLNPVEWDLHDESFEHTTFAAGNTIAPVISFTTTDPTALSYHKTALTNSNKFRAHLIRKKRNETRYADNESQHIRFEVVNGIVLVQSVSNSPREYRVEVHATGADADSFTGVPLVVSVNTAIALPGA